MKPVSIAIRDLQAAIVKAVNESQLPPSVTETVINAIHAQLITAAQAEIAQAEQNMKGESENAESN